MQRGTSMEALVAFSCRFGLGELGLPVMTQFRYKQPSQLRLWHFSVQKHVYAATYCTEVSWCVALKLI